MSKGFVSRRRQRNSKGSKDPVGISRACFRCGALIEVGEEYEVEVGRSDENPGELIRTGLYHHSTCLQCVRIRDDAGRPGVCSVCHRPTVGRPHRSGVCLKCRRGREEKLITNADNQSRRGSDVL